MSSSWSSNLLWTCEAVSFAANEGNEYDCRRPQVLNTTHLTPADARRNDASLDAPGWVAATNGQPTPRTWAEKEQRKALWMKAVWRHMRDARRRFAASACGQPHRGGNTSARKTLGRQDS